MALTYVNEVCKGHGSLYCKDDDCNPKLGYKRHQVEALLTVMWCGGSLRYEWDGPEAGMPKADRDPRTANELEIAVLDMQVAWSNSGLPTEPATYVFLHYALGANAAEIARHFKVDRSAVVGRMEKCVSVLTEHMNGNKEAVYEPIRRRKNEQQ